MTASQLPAPPAAPVADGAGPPTGPGHTVVVAQGGVVQARCSCGWVGPDRTGDVHGPGLVVDDCDWHAEWVAAEARAEASTLAVGHARGWDR